MFRKKSAMIIGAVVVILILGAISIEMLTREPVKETIIEIDKNTGKETSEILIVLEETQVTPEPTPSPNPTPEPTPTPTLAPIETQQPVVTAEPITTPKVTAKPPATATPKIAETPTTKPNSTDKPISTKEPINTAKPTVETTAKPDTPKPTAKPTVNPTPEPTVTPTPASAKRPEVVEAAPSEAPKPSITSINLDTHSVSILSGDSWNINILSAPETLYSQGATWNSSNSSIVTLSGANLNGVTIHAEKKGTATVTVYSRDGKYSASCTVTVN